MLSKMFQRGFTLIEVITAVFVLVVGLLGAFIIVQNISFSFYSSVSKLRAAYLAQEGIELIRNKRDTNWLSNNSWDSDINSTGCTTSSIFGKFDRDCDVSVVGETMYVTTTVSWQERGKDYNLKVKTKLYNWR